MVSTEGKDIKKTDFIMENGCFCTVKPMVFILGPKAVPEQCLMACGT